MVILAYYFEKKLARVNGISSAGIGVGNFATPPLFQMLIDQYGWNGALLIISGLVANVAMFGSLYRLSYLELRSRRFVRGSSKDTCRTKDIQTVQVEDKAVPVQLDQTLQEAETGSVEQIKTQTTVSQFVSIVLASLNFHLLLNVRFVLLFIANCPRGLGYVIVITYLPARAVSGGISEIRAAFLLSILGIVSVMARFSHGFLIDYKVLSATMLTALASLLAAVSCALFPVSNNYPFLAFLSVLVGMGAGVFNVTIPIVAKEYVGMNCVSGAVGLQLLSTGIGVLFGLFLTGRPMMKHPIRVVDQGNYHHVIVVIECSGVQHPMISMQFFFRRENIRVSYIMKLTM